MSTTKITEPSAAAAAPLHPGRSAVAASVKIPLLSASVSLPGPGAALKVGPAAVTLPTGPLYFVGLGALAAAGVLELPAFVALAAGGALLRRVGRRSPSTAPSAEPA